MTRGRDRISLDWQFEDDGRDIQLHSGPLPLTLWPEEICFVLAARSKHESQRDRWMSKSGYGVKELPSYERNEKGRCAPVSRGGLQVRMQAFVQDRCF